MRRILAFREVLKETTRLGRLRVLPIYDKFLPFAKRFPCSSLNALFYGRQMEALGASYNPDMRKEKGEVVHGVSGESSHS